MKDFSMDNLRKIFLKFYDKYISRKTTFEKAVGVWEKSSSRMFKKGDELLKFLEREAADISEGLKGAVDKIDLSELKKRINVFIRSYKELNEITKPTWRQWLEVLIVVGPLVFVLRSYIFGLYHVPTGSAEPSILVGDRLYGNKMIYRFYGDVKRGDFVIFDNPEFIYSSNSISRVWQKYVGFGIPILGLPNGPENWVKRVIAVPGDVIEGRVEDDRTVVYRNGVKLDEDYVNSYPLIGIVRTKGFLKTNLNLGLLNFLRQEPSLVFYTYDPKEELDSQPFYYMEKSQIYLNPYTNSPTILKAFSSTHNKFGENIDIFGPMTVPEGKYWVMGDSRKNSRDSRYWGFLDRSLILGRASFIMFSIDSEEPLWLFEIFKNPIRLFTKLFRWKRSFNSLVK